jgi:hypothetical protein
VEADATTVGGVVFDAGTSWAQVCLANTNALLAATPTGSVTAAATGIATVASRTNEARRAQRRRFTLRRAPFL